MEQKNYTLKECKAYNQKQHDYIQQFIRGNYDPKAEFKPIVIPEDTHPWKILQSVIKQFYDRECEIASTISDARCEMERALNMIKHNEGMQDTYWKMQKEIGDLKRENERLKESLSQIEKSPQKQPEALTGLIDYYSIDELIDGTGEILDSLIMAFDYSGSDGLKEPMKYTRALQRFFRELEKEIN